MTQQFDKQVGGDHYDRYSIEPIAALKAWLSPDEFRGFLRGNAIKYQVRYRDKHGVQDLEKAQWFLKALADFEQEQACEDIERQCANRLKENICRALNELGEETKK